MRQFFPVFLPKGYRPRSISIVLHLGWLIRNTHFIQYHSKAPHINFRPDQKILSKYFWSYVANSTASFFHEGFAHCMGASLFLTLQRYTKIANFNYWCIASLTVFYRWPMKQQVWQLHVSMYYSMIMYFFKTS